MPFTVFAAARPIRDAFLVAEGAAGEAACDGVVRWGVETWGGRRCALAVVGDDGSLTQEAWGGLTAVVPDRVYSFAPLSDALLAKLDETLEPWHVRAPQRPNASETSVAESADQDSGKNPCAPQWRPEPIRLPGVPVPPTKSNLGYFQNKPLFS